MSVKKSRFEQLQVLKPSPELTGTTKVGRPEVENVLESLSTQMHRDLKIALKQASAREQRKQYQLLEEAVTDYLRRDHADLLK
ncbi:hypothetical protein [Deinococcus frigens]|uniref:hypothetical protein n=1 Tax=Deinococcus frigens TaxID=249403 RepID=UPI0004981ECD|nr:hypothetical protein [Deinococcus frigens]